MTKGSKNRAKQVLTIQRLHARDYQKQVVAALVKTKPAFMAIEDL